MQDALPLFLPLRKRGSIAAARLALPADATEAPTPIELPPPPPPAAPSDTIDERRLIAILDAPLMPGETVISGYARKERDLSAAFAKLSILAAHSLRKRLASPKTDDLLAEKFARLTVERRNRLLQFLADARRRAALGC